VTTIGRLCRVAANTGPACAGAPMARSTARLGLRCNRRCTHSIRTQASDAVGTITNARA